MKVIDYETLRKRREQMLKRRAEEEPGQQIGLAYVHTVNGKQYSIVACFSIGGETPGVKDKLRYLINGQKR